MAKQTCRTCDRAADSGAYCRSCAADIMARALDPLYGGRRKKSLRPGKLPPGPLATPSSQHRLFG